MRMLSTNRTLRLLLLASPVLALAAAAAILAFGPGSANKAEADFPHPGLDFSIAVAALSCDSSSGSSTCTTTTVGQTVTVDFKLNTLPGGLVYDGYDAVLQYTDITPVEASLVQTGAGVWPGCVFAAHGLAPGRATVGCAIGIGGTSSSYTGVVFHMDFTCPSPAPASAATITLVGGEGGNTSITDPPQAQHGEGGNETLTVTCGVSGTPPTPTTAPLDTPTTGPPATPTNTLVPTTPAPVTPTNTPMPTNTPRPPTPTNTRVPTPAVRLGDVNGDGRIDSEDALWVLWDEAGIREVPLPENGDLNHDGRMNSKDAAVILQIVSGIYQAPMGPDLPSTG